MYCRYSLPRRSALDFKTPSINLSEPSSIQTLAADDFWRYHIPVQSVPVGRIFIFLYK